MTEKSKAGRKEKMRVDLKVAKWALSTAGEKVEKKVWMMVAL